MFLKLAIKSVLNRRVSALLTVMAIAVGIFVLLGVEQLRTQAKEKRLGVMAWEEVHDGTTGYDTWGN